MSIITASNLVYFINELPKDITYKYVNPKNKGVIRILGIDLPEGPIRIKRWIPSKGESEVTVNDESISPQMIWRIANALKPNLPINVDRLFGGSYNTRSVLEALLAHTPQFYYCYPGRVESNTSYTNIRKGHKCLLWLPNEPHILGQIVETKTEQVISEIPSQSAIYESLTLPNESDEELNFEFKIRHAQIQIALFMIGKQFGYQSWVTQSSQQIIYQNKRINEYEGVIVSLSDEAIFIEYREALKYALPIDCIWLNNKLISGIIEIENSTGILSSLTRMKNFQNQISLLPTRYIIVTADDDRGKVLQEANKEQFISLDTRFFSYSAVEELYSLCQRRKLSGISEEFLDCFLEKAVDNSKSKFLY
ncbi:restriction endonuclease [Nostoc punctiforme FACHB-252]|uniref:Restriction endonuclease n=1 Tax=Nostoc punctiforme FACHB-252 TaxID=1357509 RepID=A0ABR8HL27_NOSPU|nr:restriction endonuclease [Nostoc punctiforme]MBD2616223.1 restriction endonuclease [Nostoc punctiforme FACHB-252]